MPRKPSFSNAETLPRRVNLDAQVVGVWRVFDRTLIENVEAPFESPGPICFQPINGSGNSNERFFTRSG